MVKNQSAKTFSKARTDLRAAYHRLGTERAVAAEIGLSAGMVHKVMMDGYEPKTGKIRLALGLPAMAPAPVCIYCGVPHTTKRCTAKQGGKPRKNTKKIIMAAFGFPWG